MKKITLVLCLCLAAFGDFIDFNYKEAFFDFNFSLAKTDMNTVSLNAENDVFYRGNPTDRYYTNGVRLDFSSYQKNIDETTYYKKVGLFIAMNMYTPEIIDVPDIQYDDRPFAGWSRVGLEKIVAKQSGWAYRNEYSIGILGPYAIQENVQVFWHKHVTPVAKTPRGWDNQISNELAVQYRGIMSYEILQENQNYSLKPYSNLELGNVFIRGGLGLELAFGGLANYSETGPVMAKEFNTLNNLHSFKDNFYSSLAVYGRVEGNFVAHNGTIQGGLYDKWFDQDSPYTTGIHPFVFDTEIGVIAGFSKSFEMIYSLNTRSSESSIHAWQWNRHNWGRVRFLLKF